MRNEAEREGLSESLRAAVERTLAATAGSAAGTRERAQELLDEVARRGQEARDELTRRMRMVSGEELRELSDRLRAVEARVDALERAASGSKPDPRAEPEA